MLNSLTVSSVVVALGRVTHRAAGWAEQGKIEPASIGNSIECQIMRRDLLIGFGK